MEYNILRVWENGQVKEESTFQDYEFNMALAAFLNAHSYDAKVELIFVGEEYDDGTE